MKKTKLLLTAILALALMCCVVVGLSACTDPQHEHSLEHKVAKQATCSEDGNSEYWYCAGCGKYFSDEGQTETTLEAVTLNKTGHHGGTATHTDQAICEECGNPYGDTVAHVYDQEVVNAKYLKSAATCKEYAVYYKSCVDGAFEENGATFEYVEGGYSDHTYEATDWKHDGNDHWHECEYCQQEFDRTAHTGGTATHTDKAICETCGQEYGETVAHVYDQEVVDAKYLKTEATCEEYAVYYKSCVDGAFDENGETFVDTDGGYGDHNLVKTEPKAETCTDEGNIEYYTCNVCNKVFKDELAQEETTLDQTVIAPAHKYNADHYCTGCGDVEEEYYDAVVDEDYALESAPYVIENLTIGRLLVRGVKNGDVWFKLGDSDKNFVVQSLETAQGNTHGLWLKGADSAVYAVDLTTGDTFRMAVESNVDYAVISVGWVTRIEAENGVFTLAETESSGSHREVSDANNLRFDMGFSGWLSTANINRAGDSISYTFTADKDADAQLRLYIAGHTSYKGLLDEMIQVTYGGASSDDRGEVATEELAKWDMNIANGDYWTVHCNDKLYMQYRLVVLPIHVVEGANEIVITLGFGAAATMGGNLDYLEIISTANVTDYSTEMTLMDESNPDASTWEVTVAPTVSSEGTLKTTSYKVQTNGNDRSREYALPALAEGVGYNVSENNGVYTYSFVVRGQTFSFTFNPNARVTITIDTTDDVTFVGGSKTATVGPNESLPEIVNNTGREILGWYDTQSPVTFWEGDTFRTSDNDIKIAPYYPHQNGTALRPGRRSDSSNNYQDAANATVLGYAQPVIVGGIMGASYQFTANGGSDSRFRTLSAATITANEFTYWMTFQNFSDEEITFEPYVMRGAGFDTANGVSPGRITLAPGEVKEYTITITYTGTNGNSILLLKFPNAVANGYLGVAMSYSANS